MDQEIPPWDTLPNDLWVMIFQRCSLFSLQWTIPMTCWQWRNVSRLNMVWAPRVSEVSASFNENEREVIFRAFCTKPYMGMDLANGKLIWEKLRDIMCGWYLDTTSQGDQHRLEHCILDHLFEPAYGKFFELMTLEYCRSTKHLEACRPNVAYFVPSLRRLNYESFSIVRSYDPSFNESGNIVDAIAVEICGVENQIVNDRRPVVTAFILEDGPTHFSLMGCCNRDKERESDVWHFVRFWVERVTDSLSGMNNVRDANEERVASTMAAFWDQRQTSLTHDGTSSPVRPKRGNTKRKRRKTRETAP